MTNDESHLQRSLEKHEAGVADLIAAYELAEEQYFAAVNASVPHVQQLVSSNSSAWKSDANLG